MRQGTKQRVKLAYDPEITASGIRRQVMAAAAVRQRGDDCGMGFLHDRHKRLDKHLHGLKSWAVYQHVVHRVSLRYQSPMFLDCFGLTVSLWELMDIKV